MREPIHIREIIPSVMELILIANGSTKPVFPSGKGKLSYLHEQIRRRGIGRGNRKAKMSVTRQ
jgi:hypothetical protein